MNSSWQKKSRGWNEERARKLFAITPGLDREYPFRSNFLEVDGGSMHYLDEGRGTSRSPMLMVHGNPTWSFYFRKLVSAFRTQYRVVVPDHIGCGLSEKPQEWPYTLADHVANLERLVVELDLREVTLVVHDWGGPIGFGMARRQPERIARLVVLNSAAFRSSRLPLRIRACRAPFVGQLAVRGLNLFARAATSMALQRHERMTPEVKRAYLAPYHGYAARIALWKFVQDIPLDEAHPSYPTLVAIEESLAALADRPMCIIWGEKDWCFTPELRREWKQRFPEAEMHTLLDAGHYVLEDAHEEAIVHIQNFLERTVPESLTVPSPSGSPR